MMVSNDPPVDGVFASITVMTGESKGKVAKLPVPTRLTTVTVDCG